MAAIKKAVIAASGLDAVVAAGVSPDVGVAGVAAHVNAVTSITVDSVRKLHQSVMSLPDAQWDQLMAAEADAWEDAGHMVIGLRVGADDALEEETAGSDDGAAGDADSVVWSEYEDGDEHQQAASDERPVRASWRAAAAAAMQRMADWLDGDFDEFAGI
eukprot:gene6101-6339_t